MKYNSQYKVKLFKILREDLNLTRKQIILFLKISDSTYDKILSPKVSREIPKKTQYFLESIFNTEDWDEICQKIGENKDKILKMLECKMKYQANEYNQEFLNKNIGLFHQIILNEQLVNSGEDFKYLEKLFANPNFIDNLLSAMRISKFHTTGEATSLKENDELFLGFFSALANPKEYPLAVEELQKAGVKTHKKILEKFENSELFIFDKKEGN